MRDWPWVVAPIAFASATASIALMELIDNAVVLVISGALDAGLADLLFWGSLSFALVMAGAVALPLNRWLIGRGKGHAAVHRTGVHGGPSPRAVDAAAVAFLFGNTVLVVEAFDGSDRSGHDRRSGNTLGPAGTSREAEISPHRDGRPGPGTSAGSHR